MFQGKFVARVIRREQTRTFIQDCYCDEIVLALQVVSGEGLEVGNVYVRAFNRKDSGAAFYQIMMLNVGHKLIIPFLKEPGKNLQIHKDKVIIGTKQFAKDWVQQQAARATAVDSLKGDSHVIPSANPPGIESTQHANPPSILQSDTAETNSVSAR